MKSFVATWALLIASQACWALEPTVQCFESLASDPSLDVIRDKIALANVRATTFVMLTNEATPTSVEQVALAAWASGRNRCMSVNEAERMRAMPAPLAGLATEAESRMMSSAVDLYQKKISYGQYNKARQELAVEIGNRWNSALERLRSQQDAMTANARAEYASEQSRRSAALTDLVKQMQPPQPVEVIVKQQPATINCSRYLNGTTCVTQ